MRKNIVAGNWKMNLDRKQALYLVDEVLSALSNDVLTEVIFAPSYIYLYKLTAMCRGHANVSVAAQDCSFFDNGSFTSEVSASMIASLDVKYVILGHSERRINFNESNQYIKQKVLQVLSNKMQVILCCGESLEQRNH